MIRPRKTQTTATSPNPASESICCKACSDCDLLILFCVLRSRLYGNSVKLALALLGDFAATIFFFLLNQAHLLELLQDVPANLARALREFVGANSTSLLLAIDLRESTDTATSADVNLADHGGGANVEPIWIIGW